MPWPSDTEPEDEVFALIERERVRQNSGLQLIRFSPISIQRVIRASGITAATRLLTILKPSQLSE